MASLLITRLRFAAILLASVFTAQPALCQPSGLRLLIFGDSLATGFDLPEQAGFTHVLARRLRADGYANVEVIDGSVDGSRTADAAKRLESSPDEYKADVIIVELGGNDMLIKDSPENIARNLNWIISGFKARGARVILGGMLAKPEYGFAYNVQFDRIYPALAARWGASLYPFFLQGVYGHPGLMQSDHIHPNAAGVERMVAGILPLVERNLDAAARRRVARAPR
ncbi:MAG: arylesterase [Methylocystaceae bacterium]|nr:MAG: arylesterase [Methylocystaceae bacterium]